MRWARRPGRATAAAAAAWSLLAVAAACSSPEPRAVAGPRPGDGPPAAGGDGAPGAAADALAASGATVFRDAGVAGAFVLLDLDRRHELVVGSRDADRPLLPASTFKVANTLIGLETGVIPDAGLTLPWDGVEREFVPTWNRDHDLASAMEHSVLWYFQEVARRVGEPRYRDWLARLDYGNRDPGGGVDRFWVAGDLRITPRQQAGFMARLARGELPVSDRSLAILRQVMPSAEAEGVVLRAKTGLTDQDGLRIGWLAGWTERDGRPGQAFACAVLAAAEGAWRDSPVFEGRRQVPLTLLRQFAAVPPGMPQPR